VCVVDGSGPEVGSGVVVCDGVGALSDSGAVAETAARAAVDHIARHGIRRGIPGSNDDGAGSATVVDCAQHAADVVGEQDAGATTLIAVGADHDGYVAFSFVGNGTLLDAEPVVRAGDRVRLSVAELVTPHISWANGRPDLRSVIPPRPGAPVTAARGVLYPQPDRVRLLLAVTDGIASDEDRFEGISDGARWRKVPTPLSEMIDAIETAWNDVLAADDPGEHLASLLQGLLDRLAADVLTDDATVGAVIVRPAASAGEPDGR
jgi:hypothetical protein